MFLKNICWDLPWWGSFNFSVLWLWPKREYLISALNMCLSLCFFVYHKNSNLCVSLCYCVSCSSSILVCVNCKFLFLQWSFRLAHKNPICLRHLDFVFPTLGSSTLHNGELNHFKYWQIQISKYSKIFKYWQMFAKFVLCCIFCFFAGAKPSSMN